jgi:hypothetical protein
MIEDLPNKKIKDQTAINQFKNLVEKYDWLRFTVKKLEYIQGQDIVLPVYNNNFLEHPYDL